MTISPPLFPQHQIYLDEDDKQTYHLVFDGLDGVPVPFRLELTDIGAGMLETALANTSAHLSFWQFWGYKGYSKSDALWNCVSPREGTVYVSLASRDEMALVAIADVLSDGRCWRDTSVEREERLQERIKYGYER